MTLYLHTMYLLYQPHPEGTSDHGRTFLIPYAMHHTHNNINLLAPAILW